MRNGVILMSSLVLFGFVLTEAANGQCPLPETGTIACGQTVVGEITERDCWRPTPSDRYDLWYFEGEAGQTVTLDLSAAELDSKLTVEEPHYPWDYGWREWSDDNGGPGLDARITLELDTTGTWSVLAFVTPLKGGSLPGSYTLSLKCPGFKPPGQPPPRQPHSPSAPFGIAAEGISESAAQVTWSDNSANETAFHVEMRSEGGGEFTEVATAGRDATGTTIAGLTPEAFYAFRVRASNAQGFSAYSDQVAAVTRGSIGPCVADATHLCLNGGRFRARATWRKPDGTTGPGQAAPLTDDTGYFWFFGEENVEAVVKVLDNCGGSGRYWVFGSGLTNVQVDLVVTDTETGEGRGHLNRQGAAFQPIQDTAAFATCP